jgi:hypothetical protein
MYLQEPPQTANAHQRASNWVDRLGDRSWITWARAVVQQDCVKIARIKAVTSMLAELKRSEEGTRPAPAGVGPFSKGVVGGHGAHSAFFLREQVMTEDHAPTKGAIVLRD